MDMTRLYAMTSGDLITSAEAAEILGVDRSTLTRWSDPRLRDDERRLTAVQKFEGLRGPKLFRRAEVEELKRQRDAEREEARSA